jgi:type II secretory pathway pseudopilin PulG
MKKVFGFTLMETIIVIGIVGLIIPVIFSVIYSILRQQTKVYILSQIKREGDNALNIISTLIRNNAVSIHSGPPNDNNRVCSTVELNNYESDNGTNFYFLDKSNEWFRFYLRSYNQVYKISSQSSVLNATTELTSFSNSQITNFVISCEGESVLTPPIVSISFTVEQPEESERPEETASLNYQTKIKLRPH